MDKALDLFARPELIPRTARYREIDRLERVYSGTQYDGRPDWWTGKKQGSDEEVPLRERKPCIVYRLPKAATQQVVRFLFGEKRFPKVAFEITEGDPNFPNVTDEEAKELGEWLEALIEHAQVEPQIRAIANKAISCKTAVAILELDEGKFRVTLPRPQDCHAQFQEQNPDKPVEKLVWCYEFDKEVADEAGNPCHRRYMFRREWDQKNVYVYQDAKVVPGKPMEWGAPEVTAHGLSFCPVLWIRNEAEHADGIDGACLYDGLLEEFEALDMALSRRHQGIIYLGAPQLVETGVEDGDGPDANGRKAITPGYGTGADHQVAPKARRIAPDSVWSYEGENVTVELVETSGKAFEVGTNHVNDIRSRLLETMGVVLTSMADTVSRVTTGADMSARFLALAHAPLIALVQEYRHSWWPKGLRPLLSMMMRMTVETSATGGLVAIPGTDKAVKTLERFKTKEGWTTPLLSARWGKFFDPSSTEIKTTVETAVAARDGRIISSETAVEFGAADLGVDSPEREIEEIEEDKTKAMEDEAAQLERLGMSDGGTGLSGGAEKVPKGSDSGRAEDGKNNPVQKGKGPPGNRD